MLQKQQAKAEKDKKEKQERENDAMQRELVERKSQIAAMEKKLSQREIKHEQTSVKPDPKERGDEEYMNYSLMKVVAWDRQSRLHH